MPDLPLDSLPRFPTLFRRHFLAGLLVVIPLAAIVWIAAMAFRWVWGLAELLPEHWQPERWIADPYAAAAVKLSFSLAALALVVLGVSLLGWVSQHLLGRKILELVAETIKRIPVLRSVYSALDQLLRSVATGKGQQFSRVVYIEYPRKGALALAFVTGHSRATGLQGTHLNVYVPTTPNPTSGFHLIVPEAEVIESHLTVEEAFKTILSLGIAQP